MTALQMAVVAGHVEVVRLLIEKWKVDSTSLIGCNTLLDEAQKLQLTEMIELLKKIT